MSRRLFIAVCLFWSLATNVEADAYQAVRDRFYNTVELTAENQKLLPDKMKLYLWLGSTWASDKSTGFSRLVDQNTFIVVTNRDGLGYKARAAIAILKRGEFSPEQSWDWYPLYLPYLNQDGTIVASDRHHKLVWNEQLSALEALHCTDLISDPAGFVCSRSFYGLKQLEAKLLRVDYAKSLSGSAPEWTTVWEPGKWKLPER